MSCGQAEKTMTTSRSARIALGWWGWVAGECAGKVRLDL